MLRAQIYARRMSKGQSKTNCVMHCAVNFMQVCVRNASQASQGKPSRETKHNMLRAATQSGQREVSEAVKEASRGKFRKEAMGETRSKQSPDLKAKTAMHSNPCVECKEPAGPLVKMHA